MGHEACGDFFLLLKRSDVIINWLSYSYFKNTEENMKKSISLLLVLTLILAVRGLFCPLPVLNHILVNELSQNQIGRFLLGAGTVSHSPILSSFPCWYVGPRTQKTFIALAAAGWMGRKTQEEWRILENSCCAAKAMIQQNFLGRGSSLKHILTCSLQHNRTYYI